MSRDKDDRFPLLVDDDSVWLRWIETQSNELRVVFDADKVAVFKEEIVSQTQLPVRPEDRADLNMALCALVMLLHNQLESLTLQTFTIALFESFHFVPTMPKLRTLDLSQSECRGKGELIASLLRKCPNLTELQLYECSLFDDDMAAIGSVSCPLLEELNVSDNDLTAQGMKSVAEMLKSCHQIREVIFGNESSNYTSEVFACLADKSKLELLYCYNMIVDAGPAPFLQMMFNLKDLSISFAGTDSDFRALCSCLRGTQRLTTLSLNCETELCLESDQHLADLLRSLTQFTKFDLGAPRSTSSFKHLGAYFGSSDCRLIELDVHGGTKNDLLPVVSAFRSNSSLKKFSMTTTHDWDDDLPMVLGQALRHNRTLREFSWYNLLSLQHWTMILEGARYSAIERLFVLVSGRMTDHVRFLGENVANQGYLVKMGDVKVSASCRQRMKVNKRMHRAARKSTYILLAIRKFRKSALNVLQKDIVKLIAHALFATRANDAWSNALDVREEPEQKKQKM